jgi:chemotaxis signal transduction protein
MRQSSLFKDLPADIIVKLEQRAKELNEGQGEVDYNLSQNTAIAFRISDVRFLIHLKYINEIRTFSHIEPLPGTNSKVLGLMNIRGEVIPVFDFRSFWEKDSEEITSDSMILVLGKGNEKFGFFCDEVFGLEAINPANLKPVSVDHFLYGQKYILASLHREDRFDIVLDGAQLIAEENLEGA